MKIILIRHGEPDYMPCDSRGFIGHGRDLAPLTLEGNRQAEKVADDQLLKGSQLIISSPYTRTLQTAAIISKVTQLDIVVETDLHELLPDKTFQYKGIEQARQQHREFMECKGTYPQGEFRKWETVEELTKRIKPVFDQYTSYDKIIVVTHGGVIRRFIPTGVIEYCKPYEVDYEKGYQFIGWVD